MLGCQLNACYSILNEFNPQTFFFWSKDATLIDVKVRKPNYTSDFEMVKVPLLDPDSLVQYLINAGLSIPEEHVSEFWEKKKASGEEWVKSSPASTKHIPIAIYGDSSRLWATQADSKYLGIFLSFPLWRPKSTRYSRWCIFSLENAKLYGHETLHPVLKRITYKLNLLFETGVVGPGGQCFKYVCTEIRGDWEWHKMLFNLVSSWKSITDLCFRCNCVAKSPNPKRLYYCVDDDPDWKEFGLADFLADQIKEGQTCTLFPNILFDFGVCFLVVLKSLFLWPNKWKRCWLYLTIRFLFDSVACRLQVPWFSSTASIRGCCRYVLCTCSI